MRIGLPNRGSMYHQPPRPMPKLANAAFLIPILLLALCALGGLWLWSSADVAVALDQGATAPKHRVVEASGTGDSQQGAVSDARVALRSGESAGDAKVDMVPATNLWGRILRARDDRPIDGARIELRFADADQFWNLDPDYSLGGV